MIYTSNSSDTYFETSKFIPIQHLKIFHLYFRSESISGLIIILKLKQLIKNQTNINQLKV